MKGEFDPVRAQRERLAGLEDVLMVMARLARAAERRLSEVEAETNALMKLSRFTAELVAEEKARLAKLIAERDG